MFFNSLFNLCFCLTVGDIFFNYFLPFIEYLCMMKNTSITGNYCCLIGGKGVSLVVKKEKDINLFVCYHKPYFVPDSDVLTPIHVGKACSSAELGMLGDDIGENISTKNPYFCELTATYWIWKNCQSNIVGLSHYRRFFNLLTSEIVAYQPQSDFADKIGLTSERIHELMQKYDIILPCLTKPHKETVCQMYNRTHVGSDLDLVYEVIAQKYPDMAETAYHCLYQDSQLYITNMIIARKDIFNQYAAWLFDVLFAVEQKIQSDVLQRDAYQQRAYGFLAERMMRIFVSYQQTKGLHVLERPILFLTENIKDWRRYCCRRLKRKILSILGFNKTYWRTR